MFYDNLPYFALDCLLTLGLVGSLVLAFELIKRAYSKKKLRGLIYLPIFILWFLGVAYLSSQIWAIGD